MIDVKAKVRKWGNSLGIILPINEAKKEGVREGDEVTAFLVKNKINIKKMFGAHKFKKSIEKMMEETDRELYE